MKQRNIFRAALSAIGEAVHAALFGHMARSGLILFDTDPNVKTIPPEVKASLDAIADKVKDIGEKALAEAKTAGTLSTKTKEAVDALLIEFGGAQKKLVDLAQEVVALRDGAKGELAETKSAGEQFTDSDAYKDFAKGGYKGRLSIPVGRKAITSLTASAGPGVAPDFRGEIISLGRRRFTIRDLMLPGATDSNAVTYVRELGFTNNAASVSETVRKPESTLTLEAITQPVITVAHFTKASNQILRDIPQLQSYIDGRLRYGLQFAEEVQLLKGSGVGINLNGVYTQATAYVQPAGAAVVNETRVDRIRLMMLQCFLAEFPASGIVLHPTDWATIELSKDTTNQYLIGKATGVLGPTLWGLPVVETQAMTVDTGLVGSFRPLSQIFDHEAVNVVLATENEDDFVKNLVTLRAEERLAMAVYRPEGFVKAADLSP